MTYFRIYFTNVDVYQRGQLIYTYSKTDGDVQHTIIRAADIVSMVKYDNNLEGAIVINRNDLTIIYRTYETIVDGIQLFLSSRSANSDTLDKITKEYHDKYIEIDETTSPDDINTPVLHVVNRLLTEEDIQL